MGLGCLKLVEIGRHLLGQGANGGEAIGGREPGFGGKTHAGGIETFLDQLSDESGGIF